MNRYILRHLTGRELLRNLEALAARGRGTTADLLAHLAEVDARQLYREAAHPSLFSYCVRGLRLSGSMASKVIATVRAAREFPAICGLLAAGRLHLGSVVVLAPHLTADTARDLLEESAGRTRAEIEVILARRKRRHLPLVDVAGPARSLAGGAGTAPASTEPARPLPAMVNGGGPAAPPPSRPSPPGSPAPGPSVAASSVPASSAPGSVAARCDPDTRSGVANGRQAPGNVANRGAVRPDERSILRIAARPSLHEKLVRARILLGHEVRSGDPADIVEKALDEMIARLERRTRPVSRVAGEAAATDPARPSLDRLGRHIPAAVKAEVWRRDGGRCTYRSAAGQRCPAVTRLEFDHVVPVARGGASTAANLRLRCRAHNQLAAEGAFGAGFMAQRRAAARGERPAVGSGPGGAPPPAQSEGSPRPSPT